MKNDGEAIRIVQKNRKAWFNYEILDKYEAGIVLTGPEVKSIRDGKASIQESYAKVRGAEIWVINMDIAAYSHAPAALQEPKRARKLLLKRREIEKIHVRTAERGLTLVPLTLYFRRGFAKLEIGVAKGRQKHDKRDAIRKRESDRELRKHRMR
ncbi:MAG: SsrA-binding protein SmpB [Planctomycetes bacterium]|nr:SsrA-binding protein SmpB [Planctomycetota bacterium]